MTMFGLRRLDADPVDDDLPENLRAVQLVDWLALIAWTRMPTRRKAIAAMLAAWASYDGSEVRPGRMKIADMAGLDEKNAREHIKALIAMGMLVVKKRGGGRGGAPSVYRLTRPADITTLPLWLDPDFNRVPDSAAFVPAAEEYRAPAPDESKEHGAPTPGVAAEYRASGTDVSTTVHAEKQEHRAPAPDESPVDNPGTAKTPGDTARNTGRYVPPEQKHRAPAPPDLLQADQTTDQPLGLPQAGTSLGWRDQGFQPGMLAEFVGPPDVEPWMPEPEAAAAPLPTAPVSPVSPVSPARTITATAVLAATPAAAAILAMLAAQPNDGEWYRAAAARELRQAGIARPTALDIAIRAAAILRRTETESRSA